MVYNVIYADAIEKDLRKIDKQTVKRLLAKIETMLVLDPYHAGLPLKGLHKGLWRYRVGDFRIIYKIIENKIIILVLRIDHRKNIYKRRL